MSARNSRRRWMVGSAATLGAIATLPAFLRKSVAQTDATPKRLLTLFMPNSSIREHWVSVGGRNAEDGTGLATDFSLNRQTESFQPILDEVTLVHGLVSREVLFDQHMASAIRMLTGTTATGGNVKTFAQGPTFDTRLAHESQLINGDDTLVRQVVVNADTRGTSNKDLLKTITYSYTASEDPSQGRVLPENRPENTFRLLFGDASPGSTMAGAPIDFEETRVRRQSVLDFIKGDLERVQPRLGIEQRAKLDSHLTGISQLERSLMARAEMAGQNSDVLLPDGFNGLTPNNSDNYPQILQSFYDIIRVGFTLDVNRVASFGYASGNSTVDFSRFTDFNLQTDEGVHRITHRSATDDNKNDLTSITDWYVQRTSEFVQELANTPEGDGSVLDNTLIVFFCEVGQRHEHNDLPIAIIGGKNLGHPGGARCLKYPDRNSNDLGFTIMNQLGVEIDRFGDAEFQGGALQELFV